jgi:hypothetical protein
MHIFFHILIWLQAAACWVFLFKINRQEREINRQEREIERQQAVIKQQDHKIAELCQPFCDNPIVKDYLKSVEDEFKDSVGRCYYIGNKYAKTKTI